MNNLPLKEYRPVSRLATEQNYKPFPAFPAIDAHTHYGDISDETAVKKAVSDMEAMRERGVRGIISLDHRFGDPIVKMLDTVRANGLDNFYHVFPCPDISGIDSADFGSDISREISRMKAAGAKGLKFFKSLGLQIRDASGELVLPSDKRLRPVWEAAAENGLPVLIHIADPVAFWDPIDEKNERYEELSAHPAWAYTSEHPSFEALMDAQEELLGSNPDTKFIVAHVGSYSENLAAVSAWLDKYENMYVDTAARIAELGRQPYTSKRFFEKYQDRIIFGTDLFRGETRDYPYYWRFFETRDEYFPYQAAEIPTQGRWRIYGLGLDAEILEKIYCKNISGLTGITPAE